jgi:hypothetical protein
MSNAPERKISCLPPQSCFRNSRRANAANPRSFAALRISAAGSRSSTPSHENRVPGTPAPLTPAKRLKPTNRIQQTRSFAALRISAAGSRSSTPSRENRACREPRLRSRPQDASTKMP